MSLIFLYNEGASWPVQITYSLLILRGGADKSLTRPGKKHTTTTKLGIYSTYSSRSKIHFLAHCSNFCKPFKKIQKFVLPTRSLQQQWPPPLEEKWGTLNFFQSREQVVARRGQFRRIWWAIKKLEAQVGQFLLGCKCPVNQGIVVQEQDPLGDLPAAFFFQNFLQLHQQRWVKLRLDSLALWKIISDEDTVWIPKNRRQNFSSEFLHSEFWGGVSRYATTPLIVDLSPGHSDIISFVHGHQLRQEIIWIPPKKLQKLLRRLTPLTFLIRFQAFRDPLRGELPYVQIFMNDGPNSLTWDGQSLSY